VNPHLDPGLYLRPAGPKGMGVYAARRYPPGHLLLTFGGERIALADLVDFTHTIQVARGVFLGPSGGIDDYVNHSCDPNAGVRGAGGGLELFALRAIRESEEVTFDYSTCLVDEPSIGSCFCGSSDCRGWIGPFCELPLDLRARYLRLGAVPAFALQSLPAGEAR